MYAIIGIIVILAYNHYLEVPYLMTGKTTNDIVFNVTIGGQLVSIEK